MGSQNKTTYRNWEPCSNTSGQLGTDLLTTILGRLTLNHVHTDAVWRGKLQQQWRRHERYRPHKHTHTNTNTRTHTDSEPRTRVVASCKTSSGFNRAVHDITVNCSRQALIVKWEDANSTAVFFFFFKQLEVQQLRMFYRVYSRKRFPCLVLEKKKASSTPALVQMILVAVLHERYDKHWQWCDTINEMIVFFFFFI